MKCPGCGTKYNGRKCPNCGRYTDPAELQRQKRIKWGIIGGVVIGIVAIVGIIYTVSSVNAFYDGLINDMHNILTS